MEVILRLTASSIKRIVFSAVHASEGSMGFQKTVTREGLVQAIRDGRLNEAKKMAETLRVGENERVVLGLPPRGVFRRPYLSAAILQEA